MGPRGPLSRALPSGFAGRHKSRLTSEPRGSQRGLHDGVLPPRLPHGPSCGPLRFILSDWVALISGKGSGPRSQGDPFPTVIALISCKGSGPRSQGDPFPTVSALISCKGSGPRSQGDPFPTVIALISGKGSGPRSQGDPFPTVIALISCKGSGPLMVIPSQLQSRSFHARGRGLSR